MVATLPAMARLLRQLAPVRPAGLSIAGLYATNTLGAVLGVLAIAFWAVPELGLLRCTLLCAALNLGCALLAALRLPRAALPASRSAPPRVPDDAAGAGIAAAAGRRRIALMLGATGLLGIAY